MPSDPFAGDETEVRSFVSDATSVAHANALRHGNANEHQTNLIRGAARRVHDAWGSTTDTPSAVADAIRDLNPEAKGAALIGPACLLLALTHEPSKADAQWVSPARREALWSLANKVEGY